MKIIIRPKTTPVEPVDKALRVQLRLQAKVRKELRRLMTAGAHV